VLKSRYRTATIYSMISDMIRNGIQFPVMGLNLASVGFEDGCIPKGSDEDHAARAAYATRTPRNGRARVIPTRSCSTRVSEERSRVEV
jgi:hypothetical protein